MMSSMGKSRLAGTALYEVRLAALGALIGAARVSDTWQARSERRMQERRVARGKCSAVKSMAA